MIFIVTEVQISEVTFSFEALCLFLQLSSGVLVALVGHEDFHSSN